MAILEEVKSFYQRQKNKKGIKIYPGKGKVAQIILIRHGEPNIQKKKWYSRKEVLAYDSNYLRADIKSLEHLPIDVSTLNVDKVYHSSLRRATHTAELLFGGRFKLIPDKRYREFERGVMKGFGVKMPLKLWKLISRLQWFLGFSSSEIESVKSAMERSRSNAQHLAELAMADRTVIVVAHGLHNRYVSRYLKKCGWSLVLNSGNGFLGTKIFCYSTEKLQIL